MEYLTIFLINIFVDYCLNLYFFIKSLKKKKGSVGLVNNICNRNGLWLLKIIKGWLFLYTLYMYTISFKAGCTKDGILNGIKIDMYTDAGCCNNDNSIWTAVAAIDNGVLLCVL